MREWVDKGGNRMKKGETICYHRARGGEKNVYVTMLYHKDKLRGSIIENHKPHKSTTTKTN